MKAAAGASTSELDARLTTLAEHLKKALGTAKERRKWAKEVAGIVADGLPEGQAGVWDAIGVEEWPEGEGREVGWADKVLAEGEKDVAVGVGVRAGGSGSGGKVGGGTGGVNRPAKKVRR